MTNGVSPVVIDNTNIRIWEFKPYVMMAIKYEYEIFIAEPNTPWLASLLFYYLQLFKLIEQQFSCFFSCFSLQEK